MQFCVSLPKSNEDSGSKPFAGFEVLLFLSITTDQSCSVFYGPDKFSPLKLGVCDVGSSSCRCTQGKFKITIAVTAVV